MRAGPTEISSPSDNVRRDVIRSPPTNVPFLLPMSSMVTSVAVTEMFACCRETLLDSRAVAQKEPAIGVKNEGAERQHCDVRRLYEVDQKSFMTARPEASILGSTQKFKKGGNVWFIALLHCWLLHSLSVSPRLTPN